AEPAAPVKEEEIDLVAEITQHGAKGLEKVLGKLGYAKKAEVAQVINSTRTQITTEAALLANYPELGNDASPLFQKTAEIFNQLKSDPDMARSPKLMEIAARTAAAELKLEAGNGTGRSRRAVSPPIENDEEAVDDDAENDRTA